MSAPAIDPTPEQVRALVDSTGEGPVLMLNLLRFKDRADGVAAAEQLSGEEAYRRYGAEIASILARVGGEVVLLANCKQTVIGPEDEHWDLLALVRYPSREAFLEMVQSDEFLAKHAYRAAALRDSRLICCEQLTAA